MLLEHKKYPDVSLIIVTYNAEEFISDCLVSVQKQRHTGFETIIVDNSSTDQTVKVIETNYPWVTLIKSPINLGFAGGVNLGYSFSKGKYIALLNPDTRADSKWLENLVSAMDADEERGICASLMLKWGTNIVDTAGDGCTRAGKGFKIGHNQLAENYQKNKEVFAACGGAVLYRRKMIEEIGFLDPDFFLLHEDTDFSFRARLSGWGCIYVYNAVVEHKVSASIGYKSSLAAYHSVKNSDIVWLKNMPGLLLLITLPEKILNDIALFIYLGIIHRRIKDFLRAKWFVFKNLLKIIAKRRDAQSKKKISNKQIYQQLTPFLSVKHLLMLWKDKSPEIKKYSLRGGGGNDKSQSFSNNSNP